MEKGRVLALYLDAPLQSWGYHSRFDRRTTLSCPTRSGIIGMIAAAMGIKRDDTNGLARFNATDMKILILAPTKGTILPGTELTDFHTVGGGFDSKNQRRHLPRKASGDTPVTVVSRREYLQDAKFGVLLSDTPEFLAKIDLALKNPVWGLFLGRKSCIPAVPICQGLFPAAAAATESIENLSGWTVQGKIMTAETYAEGENTIMDIPENFQERRYAPRRIRTEWVATDAVSK
jgi:CRISPR system Cascade subunit CasD